MVPQHNIVRMRYYVHFYYFWQYKEEYMKAANISSEEYDEKLKNARATSVYAVKAEVVNVVKLISHFVGEMIKATKGNTGLIETERLVEYTNVLLRAINVIDSTYRPQVALDAVISRTFVTADEAFSQTHTAFKELVSGSHRFSGILGFPVGGSSAYVVPLDTVPVLVMAYLYEMITKLCQGKDVDQMMHARIFNRPTSTSEIKSLFSSTERATVWAKTVYNHHRLWQLLAHGGVDAVLAATVAMRQLLLVAADISDWEDPSTVSRNTKLREVEQATSIHGSPERALHAYAEILVTFFQKKSRPSHSAFVAASGGQGNKTNKSQENNKSQDRFCEACKMTDHNTAACIDLVKRKALLEKCKKEGLPTPTFRLSAAAITKQLPRVAASGTQPGAQGSQSSPSAPPAQAYKAFSYSTPTAPPPADCSAECVVDVTGALADTGASALVIPRAAVGVRAREAKMGTLCGVGGSFKAPYIHNVTVSMPDTEGNIVKIFFDTAFLSDDVTLVPVSLMKLMGWPLSFAGDYAIFNSRTQSIPALLSDGVWRVCSREHVLSDDFALTKADVEESRLVAHAKLGRAGVPVSTEEEFVCAITSAYAALSAPAAADSKSVLTMIDALDKIKRMLDVSTPCARHPSSTRITYEQLHRVLLHVGTPKLLTLLREKLINTLNVYGNRRFACLHCLRGRITSRTYRLVTHGYTIGEVVSMDVVQVAKRSDLSVVYTLALVVTDLGTRYHSIYPLTSKADAAKVAVLHILRFERLTGCTIKAIATDNGAELQGALKVHAEQAGILRRLTIPYTHQQNGVSERSCEELHVVFRILKSAGFPMQYWSYAAHAIADIRNATRLVKAAPGAPTTHTTPYMLVHKRPYDASFAAAIGQGALLHDPAAPKTEHRGRFGMVLGYPPTAKGLYVLVGRRVYLATSIVLLDNVYGYRAVAAYAAKYDDPDWHDIVARLGVHADAGPTPTLPRLLPAPDAILEEAPVPIGVRAVHVIPAAPDSPEPPSDPLFPLVSSTTPAAESQPLLHSSTTDAITQFDSLRSREVDEGGSFEDDDYLDFSSLDDSVISIVHDPNDSEWLGSDNDDSATPSATSFSSPLSGPATPSTSPSPAADTTAPTPVPDSSSSSHTSPSLDSATSPAHDSPLSVTAPTTTATRALTPTRSGRERRAPSRYAYSVAPGSIHDYTTLHSLLHPDGSSGVPADAPPDAVAFVLTLSDAGKRLTAKKAAEDAVWRAAMLREVEMWKKKNVFIIVHSLPPGTKVYSTIWAFKASKLADGTTKHKARLCVDGSRMDQVSVYAPVVERTAVYTVLTVAACMNWKVVQADFASAKSAF
jgi:transposase InsO family protein